MFAALDRFIKVRQFGVGRRLFTFDKVRTQARELENTDIVAFTEQAIAHDESVTQPLNARWKRQKSGATAPTVSPHGREADRAFDTCLGGIDRVLLGIPRIWGREHASAVQAQRLHAQLFPAGVGEITSLSWVDEVGEGRRIVRLAQSEEWREAVASTGLTAPIERLQVVTDALKDVLERDPVGLLFSEVRGARAKGQGYLRAIIAKCIGDYPNPTAEHETVRLRLLAPVIEQDEKIAFYNRRRRPVPDIDPQTGNETAPDQTPETE